MDPDGNSIEILGGYTEELKEEADIRTKKTVVIGAGIGLLGVVFVLSGIS